MPARVDPDVFALGLAVSVPGLLRERNLATLRAVMSVLAGHFSAWPRSHRSRNILVVGG